MKASFQQLMKELLTQYSEGINELGQKFSAVELLPQLKKKYPGILNPCLLSTRIYQVSDLSFIEVSTDGSYYPDEEKNQATPINAREYECININRYTLMYSKDNEGEYICDPDRSAILNAIHLLKDCNDESIFNSCLYIFSNKGIEELVKKIRRTNKEFVYSPENFGREIYTPQDLNKYIDDLCSGVETSLAIPFLDWDNSNPNKRYRC